MKKKDGEGKSVSIDELACRFKSDRKESDFNLIVSTVTPWLKSFVSKYLPGEEAVDDVVTRTLTDIYYKIDKYDPGIAKFSTWSYTIARNNAINYLEYESRHGSHNAVNFDDLYDSSKYDDDSDGNDTKAYIEPSEEFTDVDNMEVDNGEYVTYSKEKILNDMYDASVECIENLPIEYRVIVRDQLLYNKQVAEIALENKIPVSSAKNWLRLGKMMLMDMIKERYSKLYEKYEELDF